MADLGFDGKVAIITGAGGGLGRSHALDLAKRGALIVVNDLGGSTDGVGNTSSAAGIFGNFGQANYGAAKMGLVGLTRVLAVEGAKNNIKVNAIAPVAKTRMTEELFGEAMDKLSPELVTPIVTYLAHEDCDVTGEVYSVGGGRVARIFVGVTPGGRCDTDRAAHHHASPHPRPASRGEGGWDGRRDSCERAHRWVISTSGLGEMLRGEPSAVERTAATATQPMGQRARTAVAMASTCRWSVPQQPPTTWIDGSCSSRSW